MPFLVPIVAAVGSAIGSAIATVSAVASIEAASLAGAIGLSGAGILAASSFAAAAVVGGLGVLAISEVSSLLSPSAHGSSTNAIAFKADINAGIPYVIGRTGVGGNIVFADTSDDGHNKWLHYFTVLSIGPVTSIDKFTANNVPVTFDPTTGEATQLGYNWRGLWATNTQYQIGDGVSYLGTIYIAVAANYNDTPSDPNFWAPAGAYAGPRWLSKMWQLRSLGDQPDNILPAPSGTGNVPEWTSANRLSGLAHVRWVLQADSGAYPTGTPAPLWVVAGKGAYDPRLDSTYPGGSGPQRANDENTWAFSENPYLHAIAYLLGRKSNGARIIGVGAPVTQIDLAAYVAGANVADANAWKVGGQVFSTDSKWDTLTAILQAGGGAPQRIGALISCICQTPRVSIATLTGADFAGAVNVQAVGSRRARVNRVVPSYRSETHQWAVVPADPISVPQYITADGGQRTKGISMPLVQQIGQVGQLARYAIEDSREFGPVTGSVKPYLMGLQPGDCVTIDEAEFGLNGQALLIMDRKVDPATCLSSLTFRSETAGKHPFALGQTANPPPAPSLTGRDLVALAPNSPPWSAVGGTVTSGGVSIPAIIVTGTMENPAASNLIVRTRVSAGPGTWEHYDSPPAPVATRVAITGVGSGEVRDVGLSYLVNGIQGRELVISAVTAGIWAAASTGGGSTVTTPGSVSWSNISVTGGGGVSASGSTNAVTLTLITVPITLTVTYTGSGTLSYSLNAGAPVTIASGGTLTVNAGDTLSFTETTTAVGTVSGTVTVSNTTGGGTLGTFTYSVTLTTTPADGTILFTQSTPGSYSFAVPSDAPGFVTVEIWGGGGGGGRDATRDYDGSGGGGGGYSKKHFAVTPGTTVIAGTVGAGGAGAVTGSNGSNGTASTVTSPAMNAGGGFHGGSAGGNPGGTGGTASGGDVNTSGTAGNDWYGGGAGAGGGYATGGSAGGTAPGGGGAGSLTGTPFVVYPGGAGANGKVVITAHTS
jgi:hypothetical protein